MLSRQLGHAPVSRASIVLQAPSSTFPSRLRTSQDRIPYTKNPQNREKQAFSQELVNQVPIKKSNTKSHDVSWSNQRSAREGSEQDLAPWKIQKLALEKKFGEAGWSPRKKLSPDALEEIRNLHSQDPERCSTEALAKQFEVSPEAIRRILKSKWRASEEEQADRMGRWDRRGERIWTRLAEAGLDPPKRWRERGIRRAVQAQPRVLPSRGVESQEALDDQPSYSNHHDVGYADTLAKRIL